MMNFMTRRSSLMLWHCWNEMLSGPHCRGSNSNRNEVWNKNSHLVLIHQAASEDAIWMQFHLLMTWSDLKIVLGVFKLLFQNREKILQRQNREGVIKCQKNRACTFWILFLRWNEKLLTWIVFFTKWINLRQLKVLKQCLLSLGNIRWK